MRHIQIDADGDFYNDEYGFVFVRYRSMKDLLELSDVADKAGVEVRAGGYTTNRVDECLFPEGSTANYSVVFRRKEMPFDTPETCLLWILLVMGSEG